MTDADSQSFSHCAEMSTGVVSDQTDHQHSKPWRTVLTSCTGQLEWADFFYITSVNRLTDHNIVQYYP